MSEKREPNEPAIHWAIRTSPTAALAFLRGYYEARYPNVHDPELELAWASVERGLKAKA